MAATPLVKLPGGLRGRKPPEISLDAPHTQCPRCRVWARRNPCPQCGAQKAQGGPLTTHLGSR